MPELRLGPFPVRTERTQIEAYRGATRTSGQEVPTAFPICWLGQPQIRAAVEDACRERLPLHEGQTFEYVRPLRQDADYRLWLTLSEEADPPRLVLKSECQNPAEELCLRMETVLRLVAPAVLELSA